VLNSKALAVVISTVLTVLGRNLLVLVALAAFCIGAWTSNPVAGWMVTGASLLILDFKLRG
jgi:hypothetical protein